MGHFSMEKSLNPGSVLGGNQQRDYRKELESGAIKANAQVAGSLFRKATGEGAQSVTAAIFWLKTRAGWRETAVHEVSGPGGSPIAIADLSDAELDARIAELEQKLERYAQEA